MMRTNFRGKLVLTTAEEKKILLKTRDSFASTKEFMYNTGILSQDGGYHSGYPASYLSKILKGENGIPEESWKRITEIYQKL